MARSLLEEVPIAARALATRIRLASLLRTETLPEVLRALGPEVIDDKPLDLVERAVATAQRVVDRLRVVPNTCLYRSLGRYAMLRRAGHAVRFVMALDPQAKDIVGHAWVEFEGRPLGEEVEPRFAVTFAYP